MQKLLAPQKKDTKEVTKPQSNTEGGENKMHQANGHQQSQTLVQQKDGTSSVKKIDPLEAMMQKPLLLQGKN